MNDMTATTAQNDMPIQIEVVEEMSAMHSLRPAWDALLARDPDSGFYLSWEWMASLFEDNPGNWCVLCLWDPTAPDALCGVLPMRRRLYWSKSRRAFQTQLAGAAKLGLGEFCGILCDPQRERWTTAALALALNQMTWSHLSLRYEPTGRRLRMLAASLPKEDFSVKWPDYTINDGATNQLVLPQIELPATMEEYLASLSRNRRQKLTRARRLMSGDAPMQIRLPEPETFEGMRDTVLTLWQARWAEEMSTKRLENLVGYYGTFLDRVWKLGVLYMPTLWQNDEMIGALAHVADQGTKRMTFVVGARRTDAKDSELGLLQHGLAIEHAIGEAFKFYDFGHGDEPYKYSYGATDKQLAYVEVSRRNAQEAQTIELSYFPTALRRLQRLLGSGDIKGATSAAAQLEHSARAWEGNNAEDRRGFGSDGSAD